MGLVNWIETVFCRRECCKFIPSSKDNSRCCCGQLWQYHRDGSPATIRALDHPEVHWSPLRHTTLLPTNAYGTLEFQGGPHPTKALYIRLAHDTPPHLILELLTREWGLSLPKLLISIQGGKTNFDLQSKLKKVIRKGLLKAAKTTGAWVLSGGMNTGVTRQVGESLASEVSVQNSNNRIVSIGIAPWGVVERRQELVKRNGEVPYRTIQSPRSRFAVLNRYHSFFLLVDNGTVGKYGPEIILRRKIENYISQQRIEARGGLVIPVVCVVIEGGPQTIRQVLEYVTDSPPLPVIVCDGTGRAADILAFVHKHSMSGQNVLESNRASIISTLESVFNLRNDLAQKLFNELLQCMKRRDLITVFRLKEEAELDQSILSALLYSKHLTPTEQLSLALTWNRVDIARTHVFDEFVEWPEASLEQAMFDALLNDRIEFVKLLLEQGVCMRKFLTVQRLEELYNSKKGPINTLQYIIKDLKKPMSKDYKYTLYDIGLAINKLMGGAFRSSYSRKKFRSTFAPSPSHLTTTHGRGKMPLPLLPPGSQSHSHPPYSPSLDPQRDLVVDSPTFEYPFSELMLWAVLTRRHQMSLLMWQHGEEAVAKALVAAKLYKALAHEGADDDLAAEVSEELKGCAKEYEMLGLEMLDYCYQHDQNLTHQLLTYELKNWSKKTCLDLAVTVNHRALLSHSCCQILLADLWLGGLRTRRNTNIKVIVGLFVPPLILLLGFRSREELRSMPQTFEEHCEEEQNWYSDSEFDTTTDSSSSDTLEVVRMEADPEPACPEEGSNRLSSTPLIECQLPSSFAARGGSSPRTTKENEDLEITLNSPAAANPAGDVTFPELNSKELSIRVKLYEFYNAPITKFWAYSVAYVAFLCVFTYVVLVKLPLLPQWPEWYVLTYIGTSFLEKIREILATEPPKFRQKLEVWSGKLWNVFDVIFILLFFIGFFLRMQEGRSVHQVGRVVYCVDIIYWYLKVLEILSANKYLGPLVMMMGKMVKNMAYFVVLLLVVLMAFGVCRQSILFPNEEPHWRLARHIFYQPYFMLYGEVFAGDIDPPCGGPGEVECQTGRWITPTVMSMYLLIANILLINLMIAVFNNIFTSVNAISRQVWMFQRFQVVMEFEDKPVFPPPFILLSHVYRVLKFFRHRNWMRRPYLYGLKRFLDGENLERVHDFEEESLEMFLRAKQREKCSSVEERIRVVTERTEMISQRLEETHSKLLHVTASISNFDFHLKRIQEAVSRTNLNFDALKRDLSHVVHSTEPLIEAAAEQSTSDSASEMEWSEIGKIPARQWKKDRTIGRHGPSAVAKMNVIDEETGKRSFGSKTRRKRSRRRGNKGQVFGAPPLAANTSSFTQPSTSLSVVSVNSGHGPGEDSQELRRTQSYRTTKNVVDDCVLPSAAMATNESSGQSMIRVIPPPVLTSLEYTSLADQLESVCMTLLTPPLSSHMLTRLPPRARHKSESGVPTTVGHSLDKNPLRDAEETDYHLMEGIIQRRMHRDSENLAASLEELCTILSSESEGEESLLTGGSELTSDSRRTTKEVNLKRSPPPTRFQQSSGRSLHRSRSLQDVLPSSDHRSQASSDPQIGGSFAEGSWCTSQSRFNYPKVQHGVVLTEEADVDETEF